MLAQVEIDQENIDYLTENTSKARGDINFPTVSFNGNRRWQERVKNTIENEVTVLTRKDRVKHFM